MDDETRYRLTKQGLEDIWSWMRLQTQMCDMEHEGEGCEDESHRVALMLAFVVPTVDVAVAYGVVTE